MSNRLEAAPASTQSYKIVLGKQLRGCLRAREMRRCTRLIAEIRHAHNEGGASGAGGRRGDVLRLKGEQRGLTWLVSFGICLALELRLYEKRDMGLTRSAPSRDCRGADSDEAMRAADQGHVVAEGSGAP